MKVLIIGGAGYIGSHVAKRCGKDHSVVIYDDLSSGRRENILPGTNFIHGDIQDYPKLLKVMNEGIDAVIHLAAYKAAGESMIQPEKYAKNNIAGTINIINASVESGVSDIVFSSSAAVYGEPEYLPIDEQHRRKPENFYGFTKYQIEELLGWYEAIKGLRYASLRYFNAAGYDPEGEIRGLEMEPANLLPVLMEVAAGKRKELTIFGNDYPTRDGTGVRDYIHVTDLADAHAKAMEYLFDKKKSFTVNLGSEKGLSVQEILDASRRITGREVPSRVAERRPGDTAELYASSAKAKELLGWSPRYSDLETLISTTWEVYKQC